MKTLLAVLLLATTAFAQKAKVIEINHADAEHARSIQERKAALEKEEEDFQEHIRATYLTPGPGVTACKPGTAYIVYSSGPTYRDGWCSGDFEFSDDYKFIVPREQMAVTFGSGSGTITIATPNCGFGVLPPAQNWYAPPCNGTCFVAQ